MVSRTQSGAALLLAMALVVLPQAAAAQVQTGSILVRVVDEQGGVLPGTGITISSPVIPGGQMTGATDAAGAYRFPGPVLDDLVARGIRQDRFGERSMTEALLQVMADGPVLTFELGSFLDIGTPAGLDESIRALAAEYGRAPARVEARP